MKNCVYIHVSIVKGYSMYSVEFMKILVGRDANEYTSDEKKEKENKVENPMYRYSRYATVPIEIKK